MDRWEAGELWALSWFVVAVPGGTFVCRCITPV